MKKIILIFTLLIFLSGFSFAQDKFFTRTGKISFFSETSVEDIEAVNRSVSSILNVENGDIAVSAQMKGFEFEKALMEEHFNENYVESDKYPKATFKGKILNFDRSKFKPDEEYKVDVVGDLSLHGETNNIATKATLKFLDDKILANTSFEVDVNAYKIKIPKAVIDNIANTISVKVDLSLEPYSK
ncbi:YceI family protein [Bacteroidota bacterium]